MNMIVENLGYLKTEQILDMIKNNYVFSIYKTRKNTKIIVRGIVYNEIHLFYPKKDRVPYKSVEGRKIIDGVKIFDSKTDVFNESDYPNQMISYQEFRLSR